jgi:hypothetical protein
VARQVIDCSGDADIAHQAGVPYELGDGAGDALYPSTMFRIGHVDAERAQAAIGEFKAIDALMEQRRRRATDFPRRGAILRPQRNPSEWRANVTQLRNAQGRAVDATDARQLSAAEVGRPAPDRRVHAFPARRGAGLRTRRGAGDRRRRSVCAKPGASTRLYNLSGEDVLGGARFDDSIGLNAWPVEMHMAGRIEWAFPRDADNAFNQLPWRMLVPRAGAQPAGGRAMRRHGAPGPECGARQRRCFVMGQAAGTAARCAWPGASSADALQHGAAAPTAWT